MGRIAGKIEDLDYIRLVCNGGCGKVRRDIQRNLNHPATKSLMKRFNVDNPQKLQEVWVCKDCRKKEKTSKKGQVSSKNPTLNIETSENIKIDESMNYLIPQMESEYISRKIRGKNDLNVLQEAFDFNVANYNNKNTELHNPLLIGETGSGKTHFARYLAYKLKLPYKRVNLNGATTPEDLVGQFIPNGTERTFKWVDGWLTRFMRNGGIFVLDEINMAQADILAILNSALDRERTLILTQKDGEVIKAHPKFFCIATMNLNYEGTKPLNEALKDRFNPTLEFDYDRKIESKLVSNHKILEFADKLRISYANSELITPISTRTLLFFERNIKTFGLDVAEEILFNRFDKMERKVVEEIWKTMTHKKSTETKQEPTK